MRCPTPEELHGLLRDRLSPADGLQVESHVEQCPDCQKRLEELTDRGPAVGGHEWPTLTGSGGPDTTLPATPFLAELEARQPPSLATRARVIEMPPPELPGFEILGELGRGGMAVVYRARSRRLNRVVALKMIQDGQAHAAALIRLRLEAEAVARLQHPNIVQIHDLGSHRGRLYLVLEYVDGPSLAQKCAGSPQPPRTAAQLVETLARAIHYAHQQGIIHRDLKPGNVLLTADGTPKVADFGLARWERCDSGLTSTGAILGTPSFMAPEQAGSNHKAIGPATDVYALGGILYDMLTGRPPFRADSWQRTIRQVEQQEPVPPRRFQPGVPADLETICLKCLAKEPSRRYPSAAELADDLERFLGDEPIRARPLGAPARAWRWCRRHPVPAALTAVVACLLLLLALGSTLSAVWLGRERDRAVAARQDATARLWQSQFDQARALRLSQRPGQRLDSLAMLDRLTGTCPDPADPQAAGQARDNLRDEIIACLARPDLRVQACWPADCPGSFALTFANTFERYARRDRNGVISIRRVPAGEGVTEDGAEIQRLTLPDPELLPLLQLSPDGRFLVATHAPGRVLKVWGLADPAAEQGAGPPPVVIDGTEGAVSEEAADFSPDSRWFACALDDGRILVYDLHQSTPRALLQPVRRLPARGSLPHDLAISPDGRRVAVALNEPHPIVQVRDLVSGAVLAELHQQSKVSTVAWHPDGERLAVAGEEPRIQLWNVAEKKQTHLLECETGGIRMAFNHAGTLLASNGHNGRLCLWDPNSGRLLFGTQAEHGTVCFSRDDRYLAATLAGPGLGKQEDGTRIKVWEVPEAREYRTLRPLPGAGHHDFSACAVSPDGVWVAAGMDDGVRLFDLAGGRERAFLPLGRTLDLLFEPGSRPDAWTLLTSHGPTPARSASAGTVRTQARRSSEGQEPVPSPALATASGLCAAFRLGPPETVAPERPSCCLAQSKDGSVQAFGMADGSGAWVRSTRGVGAPDRPGAVVWLRPHRDVRSISVSPDGRWVATASQVDKTVKVWDAQSGRIVQELPIRPLAETAFSPDGNWLLVRGLQTGDGCRLWLTADWQPGPRLGGRAFAFAPDGRLVAVEIGRGVIRLLEPATGRDLARLEDPAQDVAARLCFSPDGGRLVSLTNDSHSIHVWDLRLLRRQLARRGLDLDLPPLADSAPQGQ